VHPNVLARLALLMALLPLAGCIESLFFHPDDRRYSTPAEFGLAAEDVFIDGPEGARLHGWFLRARGAAAGSVLHVHGNAANISNHLPLVSWLPAAGYNVLLFDYRGFGRSDGRPTLEGAVADTRAALAWLRARRDIDAARLVVLGHSLGGATAVRAVAADPQGVRALVVDSAFASYRGIARDAAGALGWIASPLFASLPGADADPVAAIRTLPVPLLVMHGSADRIIPIAHGEALYAAAPQPKRWLRIEGGVHLDALMRPEVRAQLADWLAAR
jgi:fermentation-respiration switch protein FrsA (DUF1100 family)